MLSEIIDEARKATQNVLALASVCAIIVAVMASAYVLGFEGWSIAASLIAGCGAACIPGAIYVAINKDWDLRRKIGLAASCAPALIVGALYFSGIAPAAQGWRWAGETRLGATTPAHAAPVAVRGSYALPALFAPLRASRKHKLIHRKRRR
jgi:hypothetical protein